MTKMTGKGENVGNAMDSDEDLGQKVDFEKGKITYMFTMGVACIGKHFVLVLIPES